MGEDHLQGKTEFGEDSSKVGTSKSNDFVTGPRHPFPPPATMRRSPFPSSQASHPLLFGCRAVQWPFEVKGGAVRGALTGDQREVVGIVPNHSWEVGRL